MTKFVGFILVALVMSCGVEPTKKRTQGRFADAMPDSPYSPVSDEDLKDQTKPIEPLDGDESSEKVLTDTDYAFAAMNRYCRSCHGVEGLRFFYSDDPEVFFDSFKTLRNPKTGKSWLSESIKRLDWPGTEMPTLDQYNRWMPAGAKRIKMHGEKVQGEEARLFLLNYLKSL